MKGRKSKKTVGIGLLLFVGLWLFPGAGAGSEPVVIGVLHSEAYPYAAMMKNCLKMALDKINTNGGIHGRPVALVFADDRGQRKPGEEAVRYLAKRSGAVMFIGAYQSSNAVYMARMAEKVDIPLLICTAADDRVTQRKWRNVYRLNPPASDYAKGLEDFLLKKIRPKSMSIVYENSPYGTGGALRMMWFCREKEIEIRAIIPYHKERARKEAIGSPYFRKLLSPLKEKPPEVIYMVSYLNDGALLVRTIREEGIDALLCGGAGGFTHGRFIELAGAAAEKVLTATLWTHQLNYPGTDEFYRQYVDKHGTQPDYHGAEAYTALFVAAAALRRTQAFTPAALRKALDGTDMMTPFGPVQFGAYDKFERQNRLPTQVLQIVNGKFECIWPENLSSSPFVPLPGWKK